MAFRVCGVWGSMGGGLGFVGFGAYKVWGCRVAACCGGARDSGFGLFRVALWLAMVWTILLRYGGSGSSVFLSSTQICDWRALYLRPSAFRGFRCKKMRRAENLDNPFA